MYRRCDRVEFLKVLIAKGVKQCAQFATASQSIHPAQGSLRALRDASRLLRLKNTGLLLNFHVVPFGKRDKTDD